MAWTRYRYGVMAVDQDAKNEARLAEVKVRLDFKRKKRTYAAIKRFTRAHKTAKQFVKTLIKGIDKHDKEAAYRRWRDFAHEGKIQTIIEEQGELMNKMNELTQLDGHTANKL